MTSHFGALFARPLMHWAVRCTYTERKSFTIYSAQLDFDMDILNCSCSVMPGHCSSILVSNERR